MVVTKRGTDEGTEKGSLQRFSMVKAIIITLVLGATAVIGYAGYAMFKNQSLVTKFLAPHSPTSKPGVVLADPQSKPVQPDVRLTREGIDRLLDALDQAVRRKDVDGVLRHITHDATITIHLKQGPQQQMALLTREEYRKTLAMSFAFPSANDFTRTNTSVSLASDERSAKVSFKSTETLRQANREFKTEGEETLVFGIRDGKPMITSLEQTFPGDST
ncbi:MAG: nuclear transport factor 2 family protein [Nitrospira sp.]|nr:nuclear transport factor 2 family protein [Nitrospira sp.]